MAKSRAVIVIATKMMAVRLVQDTRVSRKVRAEEPVLARAADTAKRIIGMRRIPTRRQAVAYEMSLVHDSEPI